MRNSGRKSVSFIYRTNTEAQGYRRLCTSCRSVMLAQGTKVVPGGASVLPEALKTVRQALKLFRWKFEQRAPNSWRAIYR
jgi:hypothetical protein